MKKYLKFFGKSLSSIVVGASIYAGCMQQPNNAEGRNQQQDSVQRVLSLDTPHILKMRESVLFADAQLLRCVVDSVSDDSRCPAGFNCVWEGNALLHLRLDTISNGTQQYFPIRLNLRPSVGTGNIATLGRYSVEFKELTPETKSGLKVEQSEYRATLIFRRK
ncbi:MAG: hypothetical protein EAZ92_16060 [Candidatus Kapaibacterium sp.]|nr:MAG: hypothetical protein EAZ92_16060 [Candidatus Kapabacteria bacterium]